MNNTWDHFQDNRVQWILGPSSRAHLRAYAAAGFAGFLFGRGADGATCACDAAKDGITNPAPINGNTRPSLSADDDGGYFKAQVRSVLPVGRGVAAAVGSRDADRRRLPRRLDHRGLAVLGLAARAAETPWASGSTGRRFSIPSSSFRNHRDLGRADRRDRRALRRRARRRRRAGRPGWHQRHRAGPLSRRRGCQSACARRARAFELGLPVAVCDVLPVEQRVAERGACRFAPSTGSIAGFGIPVLPFHDTLEDPELPGRMQRASGRNEDGDHPSIAGYRRLGESAFRLP